MKLSLSRFRWPLVACLSSALLLGCAGPQVAKEATPESTKDRGIVVVSVTHDAETGRRARAVFIIDQQAKMIETRVLRSVEEVMGIPKGSDFDDERGRVYVLEVEPGVHSVDSWQSAGNTARIVPSKPPSPLRFEVKAGEVIYIGNLNLNHTTGRNMFGMSVIAGALPEVRDRRELDLAIAERKVPAIKGRVQVKLLPLGPWSDGAVDRQVQAVPPAILVRPVKP